MALDGVLKLSLYLSLFVRNCPLKCPRRNLQNETYCYGQAQTKTPETLVVSGVLQVSGINSALGVINRFSCIAFVRCVGCCKLMQ